MTPEGKLLLGIIALVTTFATFLYEGMKCVNENSNKKSLIYGALSVGNLFSFIYVTNVFYIF
ncbi:hypothetical protein [Clostridium chrysemydis]|uniref:hypothetical protein n=1 Tax=Clostridium chrysemydis TaxID=2665504 RepID=UPI00188422F8|nr:hypothetical protein [Clostridium chrysemydis]